MKQPCLDCGTVTDSNRCDPCDLRFRTGRYRAQTAARKSNGGRPQYGGAWAAYSRAVRATATICWICGQGPKPNDPWQADHLNPAAQSRGTDQRAAAAHRSCNIARGNRLRTNQNSKQKTGIGTPTPPHRHHNPS